MPKPTQPTSCHGLGRLGGTHPGLLPGFRYLHAYIMTSVARWVGFMQSEDTLQDSSRSSRYVQYFKIDCQSCQTWVPFNVHCEEDGPKTQIHVSTHPSVQDGHR